MIALQIILQAVAENSNRPEQPVARVAEAGEDVAFVVEAAVDGGGENEDMRMCGVHGGDAFRRGEQGGEADAFRPGFHEGGDRLHGGAAGGEHGIEEDQIRLGEIGGMPEVVGLGQEGFLISR